MPDQKLEPNSPLNGSGEPAQMPAYTIRKATLADLDELMEWRMRVLHDVFSLPQDADLQDLEDANRRYYEKALVEDSHVALFVELDQKPIGCGAICLQDEMPSPDNPSGKNAYLMNIYTLPEARHHGAAACIVESLVEEAKAAGAQKIYLEATEAGAPLYASHGFEEIPGMMKYHSHPADQITASDQNAPEQERN